jgi:hypothetical protein
MTADPRRRERPVREFGPAVRRLQQLEADGFAAELVEVRHQPLQAGIDDDWFIDACAGREVDQPRNRVQRAIPTCTLESGSHRLVAPAILGKDGEQIEQHERFPGDHHIGSCAPHSWCRPERVRLVDRLGTARDDQWPLGAGVPRIVNQLIGAARVNLHTRHEQHLHRAAVDAGAARTDVRVPELEHGPRACEPSRTQRSGNRHRAGWKQKPVVEDERQHPRAAIERGDHHRRDVGELGTAAQTLFERAVRARRHESVLTRANGELHDVSPRNAAIVHRRDPSDLAQSSRLSTEVN